MAGFANLTANLNLNIQNFSRGLRVASAQMNTFARNINGQAVNGMNQLNKATSAWGLNIKSVSRVVSGILISQAFYSSLRSIKDATSATWEFTKQLEYAHIAYSNLFSDTSLATEFVNVLKDFAAKTPFSFTESEAAAKRLLAYGIQYKNVMYVMQGVLSASAIQGDSAKIEPISRALGQIYTYGKLMTQEVRQLSEAGIPAYEILQEELGLTQEQLRNLGNEAIPASVAINALVDGIQKRFGNVTVAASRTITGITSNIKDNATMLFSGLMEPLTLFIKSGLSALGDFMFSLRDTFELKGAGGVFEALFPPEAHDTLRQLVASMRTLRLAVIRLVAALGTLLKPAIDALIMVFNAFAPMIATVANVLADMIRIITSNATAMKLLAAALATASAMWVIFKVRAISAAVVSAVITGISKALAGLATMLTFVLAHPFWTLLIGLGGVLIGLSGGFTSLGNSVKDFFKQLAKFNGVNPDKVLLPSQKERANDLDKFNKRLEGTSDAMDDLAGSTGKAAKAAKGLLSFDEVFKLKEPDENAAAGIEVPDLEWLLNDINGMNEGYIPEVPDFSEYMSFLTESFLGKLKEAWNSIKPKMVDIAETAIGAALGRLVGRLFFGPIGGRLGMLAGAIVGHFWDKLAEYFNLSPDQRAKAGIIGGVGAGIGTVLGGLLGGPLGAKLGFIIGGIVSSFWGLLAENLGVVPEQHIATMLNGAIAGLTQFVRRLAIEFSEGLVATFTNGAFSGFSRMVGFSLKDALVGAVKQGVAGAIVGLGVGVLSNALTGWIAKELDLTKKDLENAGVGQTIGSIVGTIAGTIVGGPIGSLVGGALGQLAGSVLGEFWDYMNNTLKGTVIGGAAGLPIGALVGTLVGSIGGPLGMALGGAIGAGLGALTGLIIDKWDAIKQFFISLGEGIVNIVNGIVDWLTPIVEWLLGVNDAILEKLRSVISTVAGFASIIMNVWKSIFGAIGTVISDAWNAYTTLLGDMFGAIKTVFSDMWNATVTLWTGIYDTIVHRVGIIVGTVTNAFNFILDVIKMALTGIWNAVVEFFTPIVDTFVNNCVAIWNTVAAHFDLVLRIISITVKTSWEVVSTWFIRILGTIKDVLTAAWKAVFDKFNEILNVITAVAKAILRVVTLWFTSIYVSIYRLISQAYEVVTGLFSGMYNGIKTSLSDMYASVKEGIGNIYKAFTGWIGDMWDNVFGKFFGWINEGITNLREFFGLEAKATSVNIPSTSTRAGLAGHATGGIFTREHVARFAEGNKAEMAIPLENASAMQPFVDAIANGITATLAPIFAGAQQTQAQPLYVGTLIADDRGIKELERKLNVVRMQEEKRR